MKKEVRIFFTAMMFLTRLPVPRFTDHAPEYLERSAKYFPLIGWIVGGVSAIVLLLVRQVFSIELSILASIIAGILTTGAFHEDGFADVCDAFGGGWTKEKILDIMKDSRLGTYGVAGLVLMLATKFILVRELALLLLPEVGSFSLNFLFLIIAVHATSRLMPVLTIQTSTYAYADDRSKSKPLASTKLATAELLLAISFTLIPFVFLPVTWLVIFIPAIIATLLLKRYFHRWIGGYTGDCLGAIQQTTEVVCYLTLIGLWKFI